MPHRAGILILIRKTKDVTNIIFRIEKQKEGLYFFKTLPCPYAARGALPAAFLPGPANYIWTSAANTGGLASRRFYPAMGINTTGR